jgi:hypothetical protein
MALEAFRGKMVFFRGFGQYLWNFRVVGGFWHKGQGLLRSLKNFQGFLEGLEWIRTYSQLFFQNRRVL